MTQSQLIAFCVRHGVTLEQLRDTKKHQAAQSIREDLFVQLVTEGMSGYDISRLLGLPKHNTYSALRRARMRIAGLPREHRPSKLDVQIAAILPEEQHVRLRLIVDPHPERLYQRRRGDCARQWQCVDEWIEVHGSDQAACPTTCPDFESNEAEAAE